VVAVGALVELVEVVVELGQELCYELQSLLQD